MCVSETLLVWEDDKWWGCRRWQGVGKGREGDIKIHGKLEGHTLLVVSLSPSPSLWLLILGVG